MAASLTPEQTAEKEKLIRQGLYWEALDLPSDSSTKDVVVRIAELRQVGNGYHNFVTLLATVRNDFTTGNYGTVRRLWDELLPKLNSAATGRVLNIAEEDMSWETIWAKCIGNNLHYSQTVAVEVVRDKLRAYFRNAAVELANEAQRQAPGNGLTQQNVARAIKALKKSVWCLKITEAYASNLQDIQHQSGVATQIELQYEQIARIRGYPIPAWPEPSVMVTPPPKKTKPSTTPAPKPATPPTSEKPTEQLPGQKPMPKPAGTAKPVEQAPRPKEPAVLKRKSVAVLLAIFLGPWCWLYTYKKDKGKFWFNIILSIFTFGVWGLVAWVWAVTSAVVRPYAFYHEYPSVETTWPKKATFAVVVTSLALFTALVAVLASISDSGSENTAQKSSSSPPPTISVVPTRLGFTATKGGPNPSSQILIIRNPEVGVLKWSVTDDSSWLDLSPTNGSSGGGDYPVTASVNIAGMEAGNYTAKITISCSGVANTSMAVPVSLTLNPSSSFPPPPPPPVSKPSFTDDFSDVKSGWPTKTNVPDRFDWGYQIADQQSQYSILIKVSRNGLLLKNSAIGEYSDFVLGIDGRVSTEGEGAYGLLFRLSSDQNSRYSFQVSKDGRYRIVKSIDRKDSMLVNWTESQYIKKGTDQVNHLMVECRGSEIKTFVNGQFLTSVTDSSLQKGSVGIYATTFEQADVQFYFDNFYVSSER